MKKRTKEQIKEWNDKMTAQKVIFSLTIQSPTFSIWHIYDKSSHSVPRENGGSNSLPICYMYVSDQWYTITSGFILWNEEVICLQLCNHKLHLFGYRFTWNGQTNSNKSVWCIPNIFFLSGSRNFGKTHLFVFYIIVFNSPYPSL